MRSLRRRIRISFIMAALILVPIFRLTSTSSTVQIYPSGEPVGLCFGFDRTITHTGLPFRAVLVSDTGICSIPSVDKTNILQSFVMDNNLWAFFTWGGAADLLVFSAGLSLLLEAINRFRLKSVKQVKE